MPDYASLKSEREKMTRRIVKIQVSFKMLSTVFNGTSGERPGFRIETDAPSDLRVISIESGEDIEGDGRGTAWVHFTSAAFEPVADGEEPPEIDPFTYRVVPIETMSLAVAYMRHGGNSPMVFCSNCRRGFINDILLSESNLRCPDRSCEGGVLQLVPSKDQIPGV